MKRVLFLLCVMSLQARAETAAQTLRTYYLQQFLNEKDKSKDSSWLIKPEKTKIGLFHHFLEKDGEKPVTLSQFETRSYLLNVFAPSFRDSPLTHNEDLPYHLQVFNVGGSSHLYKFLFNPQTLFGELYGAFELASGSSPYVPVLKGRQELLKSLVSNSELRNTLRAELSKVHEVEVDLVDLFHPLGSMNAPHARKSLQTPNIERTATTENDQTTRLGTLLDQSAWPLAYNPFRTPNFVLGNYGTSIALGFGLLTFKGIFSGFFTCQPVTCWNCCTGTFRTLGTLTLGLVQTASLSTFAYSLYSSHNELKKVNALATKKFLALETLLSALMEMDRSKHLPSHLEVSFSSEQWEDLQWLRGILGTLVECESSEFFQTNFVRLQIANEVFERLKPSLETLLVNLGCIDFYTNIAEVLSAENSPYSYVEFVNSDAPFLYTENLVNPWLIKTKAVANTVHIGKEKAPLVILSGPNASGKSTLMRAVGINTVYLAQTLGIASAQSMRLTPVSAFHSYMETRDFTGKSSSYETDIERVADLLHFYRNQKSHEKSFLLVDEILSSTNSRDALSGSREILKEFSKSHHVFGMISTHLYDLNDLGDEESLKFHNQHMEILRENKIPTLTYKLREGRSTDNNALDIVSREFAEFIQEQK